MVFMNKFRCLGKSQVCAPTNVANNQLKIWTTAEIVWKGGKKALTTTTTYMIIKVFIIKFSEKNNNELTSCNLCQTFLMKFSFNIFLFFYLSYTIIIVDYSWIIFLCLFDI